MAISVHVRTYTGEMVGRSTHRGIPALCNAATEAGKAMLGNVDPYDDTMFNEGQLRVIATELDELIRDCPGDIAAAAHEIMDLMQFVKSSQHGQMVFSGD